MKNSISKIDPRINLQFLTTAKENQYFDRKSARIDTKKIANHISAFANASGGALVIGIEDEGNLSGFKNIGFSKLNKFKTVPFNFLKSKPITKTELINIKNSKFKDDILFVYHIEPSMKRVIRTKSGYVYLRVGDQSRRLTRDEIVKLKYDKREEHIEEKIVKQASILDIDNKLLEKYKSIIKTDLSDREVLQARGLLVHDKLSLAGVLLFAKKPFKFYLNSKLRFLRYEGTGSKAEERKNLIKDISIVGQLPRIIKKTKNVILEELKDLKTLDFNCKTNMSLEYPEFAWFEGIVNAITHRDYSKTGECIKVTMYDDRLEILSPGKLPNIIDIKNIGNKKYSRNPIIARVLSEFGFSKELNEGIKRIYNEMESCSLKPPKYSQPNNNSVLLKLENDYIIR